MHRRFVLATIVVLLAPVGATAKIDPNCSGVSATSVITGIVQNAKTASVAGLLVELYPAGQTNTPGSNRATKDNDTTDANGFYRICVGEKSGSYYDTFDVHVRAPDNATAPLYATASRPYTTYMEPTNDLDFTPSSGFPLMYMTNLSVTPNAISTEAGPANVVWTVRSKAPSPSTSFKLTLQHPLGVIQPPRTVTMTPGTAEGGGPDAGGWNRWTYSEQIAQNSLEKTYLATVRGYDGAKEIAQLDAQPYLIDNTAPRFGPQQTSSCSDGLPANGFFPAPPNGTTNHRPTVVHDVCDPASNTGSRSGADPYSLRGWLCPDPTTPVESCTEINPVLSSRTITWVPSAPLADGSYYVRWRIADAAGNVADSEAQWLKIGNTKGQIPYFTALSPGNLGQGSTGGVILGSSITSPNSLPVIGFRVVDHDGPLDVVPGSIEVRAYFGTDRTLIYEYDPTMTKSQYDPISKRGGADFDLSSGLFKATGYDLRGKPPGRYVVTASVTDYAGNNASVSWHFLLVAAV